MDNKKSKLFEAIDPCIRIFQFFGFADFTFSRIFSAREKISALWILIKFISLIALIGYQLYGQISRIREQDDIPINRIVYLLTAAEGFLALIQTFLKSSLSLEFLKRMKEVDELMTNALSIKIDYDDLRWSLLTNMVTLIVYFTSSIVIIYMSWEHHPHLYRLALSFHVPILFTRLYTQRFLFTVDLVKYYLNEVVKVLETMIENQPVLVHKDDLHYWKWNTKRNHLKIKVLQKVYRKLWEATCLINESYGLGLVYIFFVQLAFFLYLGYTLCKDLSAKDASSRQMVSISLTLFSIVMKHYYCQQCLKSVIY